jgi:DNA repair exonuclease SbcCD ATPase subunit
MNLDLEDIKSRALYQQGGPNPAQVLIQESDFNDLLVEIDRLRKSREHHRQTALDISEDNDQLQKQIEEQNLRMQDLSQKAERLEKLVPPESERGPGFVGGESWSPFAENLRLERDELRDELSSLCEEIRILKEEYDDFKSEADERIQELRDDNGALADDNWRLEEQVKRLGEKLAAKKEHSSIDTDGDEIHAISGYGSFRLTRTTADSQWSLTLNEDKVVLYNRKGRRVRAKLADW